MDANSDDFSLTYSDKKKLSGYMGNELVISTRTKSLLWAFKQFWFSHNEVRLLSCDQKKSFTLSFCIFVFFYNFYWTLREIMLDAKKTDLLNNYG